MMRTGLFELVFIGFGSHLVCLHISASTVERQQEGDKDVWVECNDTVCKLEVLVLLLRGQSGSDGSD